MILFNFLIFIFKDECSQIIIESKDPVGNSMMSFDSIIIQCQFIEQFLNSHLRSVLTNKSSNNQIFFESLPGSIAKFSRKKSCNELKKENIDNFTLIFKYCAPIYKNLIELDLLTNPSNLGQSSNEIQLPTICHDQNLFDTFKYLIEKDFVNKIPSLKMNLNEAQLQQTLILLNNQNSDDLKPPEVRYSNIYISINKHDSDFLLPFYKNYLEPNFLHKPLSLNTHNKNFEIIGVNFDIKIDLFKIHIKPNLTWLILISLFIIAIISIYIRNIFLTISILICCSISLIQSYAIYKVILSIEFFSFLNIFHIFFLVAMSADNLFVIVDTWKIAKSHHKTILTPNTNTQISNTLYRRIEAKSRNQNMSQNLNETSTDSNNQNENQANSISKITLIFYLEKCIRFLYKNTIVSILLKNFCMIISFLINFNSSIIVIKLFGIFITVSIIINMLMLLIIIPSCLVLQVKYSKIFCNRNVQSLAVIESFFCPSMILKINLFIKNILNQIRYFYNLTYDQWLPDLIISLRYVFMTLLISLSLLSFVIIFYKPSLSLPISSNIQFLSNSNPLEHYDRYLSKLSSTNGVFYYQTEDKPFIKVSYIFGLINRDSESRISTNQLGELKFDYENFNFYDEKSQLWLGQFCKDLKSQSLDDTSVTIEEEMTSSETDDESNLQTTLPPAKKLTILDQKYLKNSKLNQLDSFLSTNETYIDFDVHSNNNKICLFDLLKKIMTRKCSNNQEPGNEESSSNQDYNSEINNTNVSDKDKKIDICCDQSLPFPPKILEYCLKNDEFLKNYISINEHFLYEKLYYNKTNGQISVVEYQHTLTSTWNPYYKSISNEYQKIDEFLKKHVKFVIVDLATKIDSKFRKSFVTNGFFVSEMDFFDFQQSLLNRTIESIFIFAAVVVMIVLLITKNLFITLFLILTVVMQNATTFSILTLLGWQLNVVESICILWSIGISLNFLIYLATTYHNIITNCLNENIIQEPMSIFFKRENNTKLVISYSGSTIFMSCLIYVLIGLSLVSCYFDLYPLQIFGLFLILNSFLVIIYSFFLFLPFFSLIIPINNLCKINNTSKENIGSENNENNANDISVESNSNQQYIIYEGIERNIKYNERNLETIKTLNNTSKLSYFTTSFNVAPNGENEGSSSKLEHPSMI